MHLTVKVFYCFCVFLFFKLHMALTNKMCTSTTIITTTDTTTTTTTVASTATTVNDDDDGDSKNYDYC